MFKLLLICSLIYQYSCNPRSPRIYNVLITSKKNLSPSQAVPVYQPVLRTTSVGLAFTPFLYTHIAPVAPTSYLHTGPLVQDILNLPKELQSQEESDTNQNQQSPYIDPNLPSNVVPLQQYIPVYNSQLAYQQYIPQEESRLQSRQDSEESNQSRGPPVFSPINPATGEPLDPKQVIANLKRNPEIPDVPPPALPTKAS